MTAATKEPPKPKVVEQAPKAHHGPFILAALEQFGIIPGELAQAIDQLARNVVPLSYEAAQHATLEAFRTLPPWVTCAHCRALYLNTTAHITNFHGSDHQVVE